MGSEQPAAAGLQWAVRHSELRVILDAIRNTNSREAAARLLGISVRTMRNNLREYGVAPGGSEAGADDGDVAADEGVAV